MHQPTDAWSESPNTLVPEAPTHQDIYSEPYQPTPQAADDYRLNLAATQNISQFGAGTGESIGRATPMERNANTGLGNDQGMFFYISNP